MIRFSGACVAVVMLAILASPSARGEEKRRVSMDVMSPTMEKKYVAGFEKFQDLLGAGKREVLKRECAKKTSEWRIPCGLLMYLSEERRNPLMLLGTLPQRRGDAAWIWRWDVMLIRGGGRAKDLFPSGFAVRLVDEVANLVGDHPEVVLDGLLQLYGFADGEYAEYLADKLFAIIGEYPEHVYRNWTTVSRHREAVNSIARVYYADELALVRDKYVALCRHKEKDEPCQEILHMLAGGDGKSKSNSDH